MNKAHWIRGGLALLALGLWSGQAQAQSSVVGTWELVAIAGDSLPAVIDQDGDCREEIVSATLTIAPDSTWRLESVERDICSNSTKEEKEQDKGRYHANENSVEFLDSAGKSQKDEDGDDLDDLSAGTLEGDTLTVQLGKLDKRLTFRRR